MQQIEPGSMTVEEYLAFEAAADEKHEYVAGTLIQMAGGSARHNQIAAALIGELRNVARPQGCRAYSSDQKVQIPRTPSFRYPDVTVVCGQPHYADDAQTTLLNPTVIVEVLSDSTENIDRGEKLWEYFRIESLREIWLVAQRRPQIDQFARNEQGQWLLTTTLERSASVTLAALDRAIALQDIYDGIDFDDE